MNVIERVECVCVRERGWLTKTDDDDAKSKFDNDASVTANGTMRRG